MELWCSKTPKLLWLPSDVGPRLHNPCLIREGVLQWFWRVDQKFSIWVVRVSARAEQAGNLIPDLNSVVSVIREYLELANPGCWDGIQKPGNAPGKPVDAISADAATFSRFGLGPAWEGWEKAVVEPIWSGPAPAEPPEPKTQKFKRKGK